MTTKQEIPSGTLLGPVSRLDPESASNGDVLTIVGGVPAFQTPTPGAPASADYLVKTANGTLSAERVVTDTATIAADWSVAGQVSFNAVGSIVGWRYAMSRGSIANGNYADCVSAAFANPGAVFLVDVTVTRLSFRAAAHFIVPVQDIFSGSGSWGIVRSQQITTSGSVIGLEAQNSAAKTLSLRVRNDDSLNFDAVTVVVTCLSENAPTFATLSATGAVSTTAYWGQDRVRLTALEQGGATSNQSLIWDDTNKKWVAGGAIPTGSAGGDLTGSYPSPTLVTTAVTPGTYGDSTHAPQITIDAKGRIVAAANVAVSGGGSTDWTRLFQTTLGANAATISIPATISASYKNLVLIVSGRTTGANGNERVTLQFNGDTGNNYDWLFDQNGAVTQTGYTTSYIVGGWVAGGAAPANYPGAAEVHIYDYAGTTFYKSCKTSGTLMNAASNGFHLEGIGFWKSTSAITSILLGLTSANSYIAGTVVTLYGQS